MKKIVYYLAFTALLWGLVSACKKQDSIFEDFIVPGGLTYIGKPQKPFANPGRNRVQLTWLRGGRPDVEKARVYWNNYGDSLDVPIAHEMDTIRVMIDNLQERSYTFMISHLDAQGNKSLPSEVITRVYGENYQNSLLTRPLNSGLMNNAGTLELLWGAADIANGAIETELSYASTDGTQKVRKVPVDMVSTEVNDYRSGGIFQFRTAFMPDTLAIDTFYTAFTSSRLMTFDKKDWSVLNVSSEHPGAANLAINLVDGTDATRWHAHASASDYPHSVTIDMGAVHTITRFGVWGTTNSFSPVDPRGPDEIQFLVSVDNLEWTDVGRFTFNRLINGEQVYDIDSAPTARYFKLVALSGPERFTVLGEVSAYGY